MAFYIELIKTEKEDQNFVHYVYQFSRTGDAYINAKGKTRYKSILVSGKLILNKRNGHIDILELAEGDNGMYVQRASSALVKHWKRVNSLKKHVGHPEGNKLKISSLDI